MKLSDMDFEDFLLEQPSGSDKGIRTVNIKGNVHQFYKKVANHYDVGISTIISNILIAWKEEHKDEIKSQMINRIKSIDL